MSHSVKITLIADQEIKLFGDVINIHDITAINVDSHGKIVWYNTHSASQSTVAPDDDCWCNCRFEGDGCQHIGVEETCNHPNRCR